MNRFVSEERRESEQAKHIGNSSLDTTNTREIGIVNDAMVESVVMRIAHGSPLSVGASQ